MKHSLRNDTGLSATKAVDPRPNTQLSQEGPRSAPQEKLLAGKPVGFKNAEKENAVELKSYLFEE